jgi:hypothetical protein
VRLANDPIVSLTKETRVITEVTTVTILICGLLSMAVGGASLAFTYVNRKGHAELAAKLEEMTKALSQIAASKRLSTYLTIEKQTCPSLAPGAFEPNKPVIEARMLAELEEQIKRGRTDNPSFAAHRITHESGVNDFVSYDSLKKIQECISRLITNDDHDGVRKLIKDFVAAL